MCSDIVDIMDGRSWSIAEKAKVRRTHSIFACLKPWGRWSIRLCCLCLKKFQLMRFTFLSCLNSAFSTSFRLCQCRLPPTFKAVSAQVQAIADLSHEVTGVRMFSFYKEEDEKRRKTRGPLGTAGSVLTMWQRCGKLGHGARRGYIRQAVLWPGAPI